MNTNDWELILQRPYASHSHMYVPAVHEAVYTGTGQGRWRSEARKVTAGLAEGNGIDGFITYMTMLSAK